MRLSLRRNLARLSAPALVAGLGLVVSATQASAATMVRECKASNISCISHSGYNGASVWGFPVGATGNNCVNYAAYRLSRNGLPVVQGLGSGGSWAATAKAKGYRVDRTPAVGSIAQWNYGSSYAPTQGHVGYVEEVTASYIVISDSAWSGYSSRWRVPVGDRNWPSNFIHFKDQAFQPTPSGTFVQVRETGAIFRLVGRTPTRVVNTTGLGTVSPYLISSTSLATLPAAIAEGTFVQGSLRGDIYRITGGAPLYVRSWASVGGAQPYVRIDQKAIDSAGTGGDYNRMRKVPVDGQVLRDLSTGKTYVVKAGIALQITNWGQVGGYRTPAPVEPYSIRYAGAPPQYIHLAGTGTAPPLAPLSADKTSGLTGRLSVDRAPLSRPRG
jgi:surface antigen